MPKALSPRRYAQAVFQIAAESGDLDEWAQDLETLSAALQDPDLSRFLDAPQVSAAAKTDAITQTLASSVGPLALNLVLLLGSRSTAGLMPGITEQYDRLLNAHRGIESGEVVAAVSLNDEQQGKVAQILEGVVGTKVRLTAHAEPSILGGLIARVGDRVIDGSLKNRLKEMRRSIVERA
jgi:F-type H+-transporting ATPase subunit delta